MVLQWGYKRVRSCFAAILFFFFHFLNKFVHTMRVPCAIHCGKFYTKCSVCVQRTSRCDCECPGPRANVTHSIYALVLVHILPKTPRERPTGVSCDYYSTRRTYTISFLFHFLLFFFIFFLFPPFTPHKFLFCIYGCLTWIGSRRVKFI